MYRSPIVKKMFHCYGCQTEFATPSELIKHMRLSCSILSGSKGYNCGESDCIRHFLTTSGLRQHLIKCHAHRQTAPLADNNSNNDNTQFSTINCENTMQLTSQPSHSHGIDQSVIPSIPSQYPSISYTQSKDVNNQIAIFLSSIYSKMSVPRNVVQLVAKEVENLLSLSKEAILNNLQNQLKENNIEMNPDLRVILDNVLEEFSSSMYNFKSEYLRFKFFEKKGTLIQPTEFRIGQRLEVSRGPDSKLALVPATMQVIAVADVLKQLLLLPGVMKDILEKIENQKDSSNGIENIMQGSVWINILSKLKDDECLHLPLILFFDDFEVGNPLGSHSGIHKLGGIYISLPFLPVHYMSQLNNIIMIGLFHSADRVAFGNNMVFQKVFDQLNNLEKNGINIETDSYKVSIKFHVSCLTGDNLGLNSILGFVESFSANRYCRVCFANKEQMKELLFEKNDLLRNIENYKNDVNVHNSSETGIKEKCIFLDSLASFDMFEQVAVDLLHDFLEGTCRYVLTYVVKFLVFESKLISSSILQNKIKFFDYGPDSSAKPLNCLVVEGNANITIRTSAAEMITLVRYFGLIAGFYIPEKCEPWELYLYLRKILDRLLNPRVTEDSVQQLKFWIAGLNELFCKLTKSHLRPKFHFMTHYPSMLLKFGPLTQIWTMRFEAKHRVLKIAARTSCNKVNICKTVALKNQLVLNHVFLQNKPFVDMTFGKKNLASHKIPEIELESFGLNGIKQYSVKWVVLTGHKIGISSNLTIDLCTNTYQPLFGKVLEIFVISNNIFFYVSLFETVGFNTQFFAYKVSTGYKFKYINSSSLLSVVPNTLTTMRDGSLYITLRMPID
jgi:hypothetical protein